MNDRVQSIVENARKQEHKRLTQRAAEKADYALVTVYGYVDAPPRCYPEMVGHYEAILEELARRVLALTRALREEEGAASETEGVDGPYLAPTGPGRRRVADGPSPALACLLTRIQVPPMQEIGFVHGDGQVHFYNRKETT